MPGTIIFSRSHGWLVVEQLSEPTLSNLRFLNFSVIFLTLPLCLCGDESIMFGFTELHLLYTVKLCLVKGVTALKMSMS